MTNNQIQLEEIEENVEPDGTYSGASSYLEWLRKTDQIDCDTDMRITQLLTTYISVVEQITPGESFDRDITGLNDIVDCFINTVCRAMSSQKLSPQHNKDAFLGKMMVLRPWPQIPMNAHKFIKPNKGRFPYFCWINLTSFPVSEIKREWSWRKKHNIPSPTHFPRETMAKEKSFLVKDVNNHVMVIDTTFPIKGNQPTFEMEKEYGFCWVTVLIDGQKIAFDPDDLLHLEDIPLYLKFLDLLHEKYMLLE